MGEPVRMTDAVGDGEMGRISEMLDVIAARGASMRALNRVAAGPRRSSAIESEITRYRLAFRRLAPLFDRVAAMDDRLALYGRLRYAEGLSIDEVARVCGVGRTTVKRDRRRLIGLIAGDEQLRAMLECWIRTGSTGVRSRHRVEE